MTLSALRRFGIAVRTEFDKFVVRRQQYRPARFRVEGDWSSASYFLALGAVSDGVTVDNLSTASLQGDRAILDHLRSMGAGVRIAGNSVTVTAAEGDLKALTVDFSDCIDLLPSMAVLAALANGTSQFVGIERARIKESNRVATVKEGLQKMGVYVTEDRDRLTIRGLKTPDPEKKAAAEEEQEDEDKEKAAETVADEREPVVIDSHGDHRIAMAFGILGAALGGVTIEGVECVSKTFPDFWKTLQGIGGKLKSDAQ
jgi:3-phosphoshikimate 1-carboxyvinyltransferase